MPTTQPGLENPTDDVPDSWCKTGELEWTRDDGALLRVRVSLPTRSAAEFNHATHTDASGQYEVLFHARGLPSVPTDVDTVGTRTAARLRALEEMERRS